MGGGGGGGGVWEILVYFTCVIPLSDIPLTQEEAAADHIVVVPLTSHVLFTPP